MKTNFSSLSDVARVTGKSYAELERLAVAHLVEELVPKPREITVTFERTRPLADPYRDRYARPVDNDTAYETTYRVIDGKLQYKNKFNPDWRPSSQTPVTVELLRDLFANPMEVR